MGVTVKSLGIDKLPIEERLALVDEIWDGISSEVQALNLNDEMKAELDRRITLADTNPNASIPWDLVKLEAEARLKK
jgi:putative addiction module component (TIGR02574 family)